MQPLLEPKTRIERLNDPYIIKTQTKAKKRRLRTLIWAQRAKLAVIIYKETLVMTGQKKTKTT